jgi:hydroxymethylbilane synthase
MAVRITLGTRGSELALRQARLVTEAVQERWSDVQVETKVISTSGDQESSPAISMAAGRKGLFTAEIERALVAGEIDLAVHSAKDLPSELNLETHIAAVLPRGPVEDILISHGPHDLESLPINGIIATGSVRRRHQIHWRRPDLEVVDLRGNVPTRLRKLAKNEWDAIILAAAGLTRLAATREDGTVMYEEHKFFAQPLPRAIFLPAGGQGVIAVQIRTGDDRVRLLLDSINDFDTRLCLRAEREFLRLLQGDCNQPVGVLATMDNNSMMKMRAQVFDSGAPAPRESIVQGASEEAEALAAQLFESINATS